MIWQHQKTSDGVHQFYGLVDTIRASEPFLFFALSVLPHDPNLSDSCLSEVVDLTSMRRQPRGSRTRMSTATNTRSARNDAS